MSSNQKSVGQFIATALISFAATNIDDLVVLMNFFTEATLANSLMKARHVFIGQYVGFIILIAISLIGYGIAFAVPVKMLGFLGFLPIILGIKGIVEIIIEKYKNTTVDINDIIPNDTISTVELEIVRYRDEINQQVIAEFTIQQEQTADDAVVDPPTDKKFKEKFMKILGHCLNLQTLKVAGITLANSGDNVAIYAALFAQATGWQIAVYIIIYLLMVLVWLLFCYYFINFRPILNIAQKYAHYVVPVIFIGIGIYIIVESECFPWLVEAIKTKNFVNG